MTLRQSFDYIVLATDGYPLALWSRAANLLREHSVSWEVARNMTADHLAGLPGMGTKSVWAVLEVAREYNLLVAVIERDAHD